MQRTSFTLLALCFSLTASLQAEVTLNPLTWLDWNEKDIVELNVATAQEEVAAASELETGKAKLAANSTRSARRTFKDIIEDYPNAKATAEARYLLAQIQMSKGKWVEAFTTLQILIFSHPNYENFDQVIAAQFDCATALMEGARSRLFWVIPAFEQKDVGARQFAIIVGNAPYSDYAPLALMNIAIISEEIGEPEEAIDALDRLINYYPQSMLAPDAYYNMAEVYASLVDGEQYDQGSTRQAISYYEDFLILFPQSNYLGEVEANLAAMEDLLARSRLNLGDFYYIYRSNNTAALVFYNETITIAPESEAADEARQRIADIEAGVRPTSGASILRKLLRAD